MSNAIVGLEPNLSQGSTTNAPKSSRLLSLDAMRGIAALLVLMYHMRLPGILAVHSGYLAVDFFFLLSGYVIARTYENKLLGELELMSFTKLRLIRLYPLMIVGLMLGAINMGLQLGTGLTGTVSFRTFLVSLFLGLLFLPSFITREISPLNGPGWSLILEMAINLIYAKLLVRLQSKVLGTFALFCAAVVVVETARRGNLDFGFAWPHVHVGVARVTMSFIVGVLIWRKAALIPRHGHHALWAVLILAMCMKLQPTDSLRPAYDVVFVLFASPALLWAGLKFEPPIGASKIAAWLGLISYPIYIIHVPLLLLTRKIAIAHSISAEFWMPVFFATVVLLAWLLAKFFDEPIRKWLTAKAKTA
ncbi:MAG: acyltransferase [Alphaproteobacteria bacterium]|nr:MAG: acyltransferase [Alphaproteobacteria bacterium]